MKFLSKNGKGLGDIRVKNIRQVSTAVADGTIAAIHAAM